MCLAYSNCYTSVYWNYLHSVYRLEFGFPIQYVTKDSEDRPDILGLHSRGFTISFCIGCHPASFVRPFHSACVQTSLLAARLSGHLLCDPFSPQLPSSALCAHCSGHGVCPQPAYLFIILISFGRSPGMPIPRHNSFLLLFTASHRTVLSEFHHFAIASHCLILFCP